MNTANRLTMLRVLMIPLFLLLLYMGQRGWALAVFVLASCTDLADGYVARRFNQITDFGKFMDPLADKVLVLAAMLWLVEAGELPAWVVLLVVLREFAVSGLRLIAVDNGRVIAAAWSGKVKTAATMVCLCLMLYGVPPWQTCLCWGVIAVTTLWSGVEYFVRNRDVFAGGSM